MIFSPNSRQARQFLRSRLPLKPAARNCFFGLGAIIGSDDGARLAAIYMQLAHFLDPDFAAVSMALGDIFHRADQCGKAIEAYAMVPKSSPIHRNAAIQTGICLNTLERTDEGADQIKRVIDADPSDVAASMALGNLYRNHDRFAEAGEAYTIGIDATTDEAKADWRIYYFRGISYEQTKRWPEAEGRFQTRAGNKSRPATGPKLPRLFLGRHGSQSR